MTSFFSRFKRRPHKPHAKVTAAIVIHDHKNDKHTVTMFRKGKEPRSYWVERRSVLRFDDMANRIGGVFQAGESDNLYTSHVVRF